VRVRKSIHHLPGGMGFFSVSVDAQILFVTFSKLEHCHLIRHFLILRNFTSVRRLGGLEVAASQSTGDQPLRSAVYDNHDHTM